MLSPDKYNQLLLDAGFKIYTVNGQEVVVAADNGSSGNATRCATRLIELVVNELRGDIDGA